MKSNKSTKQNDLGQYIRITSWSDLTLMCYTRGCRCKGCEMTKYFTEDQVCQTKASVLESVRVLGAPFERKNAVLSEVVVV